MTVDELYKAIETLNKDGFSNEKIINMLYRMHKDNKLTYEQFEAIVGLMGFVVSEEIKQMSEEERKHYIFLLTHNQSLQNESKQEKPPKSLLTQYYEKFNEPPVYIVTVSNKHPKYQAMINCCVLIDVKATNEIINSFFRYENYDVYRPNLKDNIVEENDLQKYIDGQKRMFKTALKEIQAGKKVSHYMWYIFPQIKGLGESYTSKYYAINDLNQAKAFMHHEDLSNNLLIISAALLELKTNNPVEVFGQIDSMKLHSSMTLFYIVTNNTIFKQVIDKFYEGRLDDKTIYILHEMYTKEK